MSRVSLIDRVLASRAQREAAHRRRHVRTVTQRDGVRSTVDGRDLLNFSSNDYLGLSQHPRVIAALRNAADKGAGSTASHLVCGHGAQHAALERELADWLQAPRALLFGSGYLANLAVVQALLGDGDLCVQDKLNHASLIDAARLAGCAFKRYPHNDAEGAARQLASHPDGAALLASDGVFSMDGDVAPLRELAQIARAQQATLYIDDAHAVGVLGQAGRGSTDAAHLAETARPYIYTTALPPAQIAATREAVRIARAGDDMRARLRANIEQLKAGARSRGLALMPSDTPIQPLLVGNDTHALAMAAALEVEGYWVVAIRPPTVPEGRARLRITLSAAHEPAHIDGLLDALARARDMVMA